MWYMCSMLKLEKIIGKLDTIKNIDKKSKNVQTFCSMALIVLLILFVVQHLCERLWNGVVIWDIEFFSLYIDVRKNNNILTSYNNNDKQSDTNAWYKQDWFLVFYYLMVLYFLVYLLYLTYKYNIRNSYYLLRFFGQLLYYYVTSCVLCSFIIYYVKDSVLWNLFISILWSILMYFLISIDFNTYCIYMFKDYIVYSSLGKVQQLSIVGSKDLQTCGSMILIVLLIFFVFQSLCRRFWNEIIIWNMWSFSLYIGVDKNSDMLIPSNNNDELSDANAWYKQDWFFVFYDLMILYFLVCLLYITYNYNIRKFYYLLNFFGKLLLYYGICCVPYFLLISYIKDSVLWNLFISILLSVLMYFIMFISFSEYIANVYVEGGYKYDA